MAPLSLKIILDEGAVTRTVMFESTAKVSDAHEIIKERVLTPDNGKEYALFLTSADDDRSGVWLDPHQRLEHYMLRNGDSLLYLHKQRNLRVKMLDGSVKTLQVDESKNIGDLMLIICGKIGITNYDEYGLCQEEVMEQDDAKQNKPVTGTLTLKRKAQQRERDAKMDQLSKKLKSDDTVAWLDQHRTLREMGVEANETLLLKRRLFFSDRNIDSRDPVQLNLLYVQTRDAILNGRHPVTEAQAHMCKSRWVNIRDMMRRKLRERLRNPNQISYHYRYEEQLSFILPYFRERSVFGGAGADNTEFEDNCDIDDSFMDQPQYLNDDSIPDIKILKRRIQDDSRDGKIDKNSSLNDSLRETGSADSLEVFLLSIGTTLRKLTPYYLNQAKSKIFQIVQEYELEQICSKNKDCRVSNADGVSISR